VVAIVETAASDATAASERIRFVVMLSAFREKGEGNLFGGGSVRNSKMSLTTVQR
jgi:hypothetical protein